MGIKSGYVHVHVDPSLPRERRTELIMGYVADAKPVVPHGYWPMGWTGWRNGKKCVDTGPCDVCNYPVVEVTTETYEWPDGQEFPDDSEYDHDATQFDVEDDDIDRGDTTIAQVIGRWLYQHGFWESEFGSRVFRDPDGSELQIESSPNGNSVYVEKSASVYGVSDGEIGSIRDTVRELVALHRFGNR